MSWDTEQWARKQRAGDPVRKAILVAVANEADTSGCNAFPSVKFLAYECEVSARTVQRRLIELEDMGLLRRVTRWRPDGSQTSNGYDLVGYEPPFQFKEDAKGRKRRGDSLTPPRGDRMTGQGVGGVTGPMTIVSPPMTSTELPFPPSPDEGSGESPPKGGEPLPDDDLPEPEAPKARRGSRLPEDWTPPPVDTLPQTVQAVVAQWPAGAYEFVAAGFAAHWTAETGRRASKRDWKAAWTKWLTSESPRVMATARAGVRFAREGDRSVLAAIDEGATAGIAEMQAGECDRVRLIRNHLKTDLGEQTYNGWLGTVAMGLEPDGTGWFLTVVAPSKFQRDWLLQNFALTIRAMAVRVLQDDGLGISVESFGER